MKLGLVLLLASGVAQAALCAKVEYVDARDWPIKDVEQAYCDVGKSMSRSVSDALEAQKAGSSRDANAILAMGSQCAEQQAMFGRVIQNVHKRPLPACK